MFDESAIREYWKLDQLPTQTADEMTAWNSQEKIFYNNQINTKKRNLPLIQKIRSQ
mgnify:CR=1 FL=1